MKSRPSNHVGAHGSAPLQVVGLIFLPLFLFAASAVDLAQQHFHTGLAYERLGRLDESYTELQLATNLDPSLSQVSVALGIVATRLGHYDEAIRALEHSIALDANSCASYYQLGFLYEKKGLEDRAAESWQRFLALNQDASLKAVAQKHIRYLERTR